MIFYFSGTGNTLHAARKVAAPGEQVISMAEELQKKGRLTYQLAPGESVGFFFPVYAWAVPRIVERFVRRCSFKGYEDNFTYGLCTCGSEAGNAMEQLSQLLQKKKMSLHSAFSVAMPDNYIVMFDVDSPTVIQKKLEQAEEKLGQIAGMVHSRQRGIFWVTRGKGVRLKQYVVTPLFHAFAMDPRKFHATDACVGCNLCSIICPTGNIVLKAGRPVWGRDCARCLACIHRCPREAIQYGKGTYKRGRYCHPDIRQEDNDHERV
ncbi:MAG: EFR1 family ferrodoxin [Eubacteriales bacterium]|jgi:ferredoxin